MILPKDILFDNYVKPRIFLCEVNKEKICQLETMNTKCSFKFNSLSELSFETARVYNDIITGETKVNPFFDKIQALRLIYVEGFGYFELQGPELISDGIEEKKSCTAYSLEYTLAQKYLSDFIVNTGAVNSLEVINATSEKDITPITLYNPLNPRLSLLHLVLSEVYGWKIGHVDVSLRTLSRQFEVDRESVYDFLMNEACEKFNCYIVFDTIKNEINVYAESLTSKFIGDGHTNTFVVTPPFAEVGTVSVDGYKTTRWEYNASTGVMTLEDVPVQGAHIEVVDGALTEWETDVCVSFDNLAQEVNISYDADAIKTRLVVTYGDDYDIREANLGLPYLTDLSYYYTKDWMGEDLYAAYTAYLQKSNASQSEYTNNAQEILRISDHISYEENRLSLEYSLVDSVSSTTVGTYYTRQQNLDGSYYYSEVSLPSEYVAGTNYYSNLTTNVTEDKVSNVYRVLKSYFYAYFNDDAEKKTEALEELNGLLGFEFMKVYTLKYLHDSLKVATKTEQMDIAIYNFLGEIWVELGRTPLNMLFLDPYKQIQEANIQAGWSTKDSKNYGVYYPVVLFINSIESEIMQRNRIIAAYENERSQIQAANATISSNLSMRNNFTEAQLIRLSPFLREDELHLDDIVETELDDISSSFKLKQDAMESGRIELQKISQPQLQFSMTMANIYALPEFAPIIQQFQLGSVIRVAIRPDYQKQSRLLQVDINFDDFSDFACEFGELTSLRTQSDIHADLLSNAIQAGKSVATNSGYWTKGSDVATATDLKIRQGLLDATTQIKSMDGTQGVVIDKYGIKLQKMLENGELDPRQAWLVNNMILMSDDGFKTSRSALGEVTIDGETFYGLIAEMVLSGYIEGSRIVGGTINIGNGAFVVHEDGTVTMNASGNTIDGYAKEEDVKDVLDYVENQMQIVQDNIDGIALNTTCVKFFGGSNIFSADDLYLVAYVEVYQNSVKSESIATNIYCSGVSSVSNGVISTTMSGDFSNGDKAYFICRDTSGYIAILGEYTNGVWNSVDVDLQYEYHNTFSSIQSNVIVIPKEKINKSQNIDFTIFKDGSYVASANTTVIDINDPVISDTPPENPKEGQLWLNTSMSPYMLHIYENDSWIVFSQHEGQAIYTSKPSQYKKGDLWILADGQVCRDFGPGSMLKATVNSTVFNEAHWIDADAEYTELKNNIKQTFGFDPDLGVRIGQVDQKFYVNISSTEMGFYDNQDGTPDKVVSISNKSAVIKDIVVEDNAEFDCNAKFNKQVDFFGFIWQKESNGSLSLAVGN